MSGADPQGASQSRLLSAWTTLRARATSRLLADFHELRQDFSPTDKGITMTQNNYDAITIGGGRAPTKDGGRKTEAYTERATSVFRLWSSVTWRQSYVEYL